MSQPQRMNLVVRKDDPLLSLSRARLMRRRPLNSSVTGSIAVSVSQKICNSHTWPPSCNTQCLWDTIVEFRTLPRPQVQTASCRSEEHTSELQSLRHLVCRLL